VLFSKLHFKYPQSDARTKANMKYLYDKALGYQVLDLQIKEMDDPLELSELCPNLKLLQVEDCKCEVWDDSDNATLAQNWEKLEIIKENSTGYLLVMMKLLDAPLYMRSLVSLRMDLLYQSEEFLQLFIEKLKHAPMLELLYLEHVFYFNCKRLDLLHENTFNLQLLELREVNYLFVHDDESLEENHPRLMNSSVASKLRTFCITFESEEGFVMDNWEANGVRCIEYISRKYNNLESVAIHSSGVLESQNTKETVTAYLKKAFCNWIQLKKFDMRPVYLSYDVLHAMDSCNICLQELKVYIHSTADMEQFVNLAHSNQGKVINKLSIEDDTLIWPSQGNLIYYLQSLVKDNCQLKAIDIHVDYYSTDYHFDILTPIQVLDYVPYLQRLSMRWDSTGEMTRIIYNQKTHLIDLDLELFEIDTGYMLEYDTLKHVQDLIYASPLLQSFSITFFSTNVTLDFEQNTKLIYFNCTAQPGHSFQIIQNHQTRWYTFDKSETHSNRNVLKEESQRDNKSITLNLPSNIHSLFIYGVENPL
jgi:hypothetical protein